MTEDEARHILTGLFYKPGWEMSIVRDWSDRPMLRLRAELIDSTTYPIDPTKKVAVVQMGYAPLEFFDKPRHFTDWLSKEFQRLEIHESREWLRSVEDGKPIDDPHAYDRREA